jgi:DNA-binding CsgD family transcriptional regulator
MRHRFCTAVDLKECVTLLPAGFRPSARVRDGLIGIWRSLLSRQAINFSVVEDLEAPAGNRIRAFGCTVFMQPGFVGEFLSAPAPCLSGVIYERMLDGRSPILPGDQWGEMNSAAGLDLVILHFGCRDAIETAAGRRTLVTANTCFHYLHDGFRLRTLLQEVYGQQEAAYMRAGGFVLHRAFEPADVAQPGASHSDLQPHLFRATLEDVPPGHPLMLLFRAAAPRFFFSRAERRVLQLALLGATDVEAARYLGVSRDAVKRAWTAIYDRVARVSPLLVDGIAESPKDGHRGTERKRHLLSYLQQHLEEVRPWAKRLRPGPPRRRRVRSSMTR